MATYYFEGQPILAPFTIESRKITLSSETASGKFFRRTTEDQRWDLSFRVQTNDAEKLFMSILDDKTKTKSMTMPQLKYVDDLLSPITSYPYTIGAHYIGESSVTIYANNMDSYVTATGGSGVIPRGAFIQFYGHDKIYTVTEEVIEGTSRELKIFPSLRADVPNGTSIGLPNTPLKPQFKYIRAIDNISGITYSDGIMVDMGTITIHEKV